jgi:alanine-synthesizing transaminase
MASAEIRLSRRLPWREPANRLARAAAERAARGGETIDLTVSNPTRVGLRYPEAELAEILGRAAAPDYAPQALGLATARAALAAALGGPGDEIDPDDLVLTASTSEAYSYLFKLFADPGDEVLTGVPSYPLLDSLAALDALALRHFRLEAGRRRFALDPGALARAVSERTRLLVAVHPGNPAGSYLSRTEQDAMLACCRAHGMPLISDEVFADFPLAEPASIAAGAVVAGAPPAVGRAGPAAARGDALAFSLGGLSKSAGLPSWKLGWVRAGGPPAERRRAVAALELLADSYLSVSTPVQRALPGVLALAPRIRAAIRDRLLANLGALRGALARLPEVELLPPEAGWSAVLRVPCILPDEDLALALLDRAGVLVHPGFLFDFPGDGYLALSLLPEPAAFETGVRRMVDLLAETIG